MTDQGTTENRHPISVRSLVIGTVFTILFTFITVYFENRKETCIVATQIAPAPFVLLFVMVFMINPVCRFLKVVRRFTTAEVLIVFVMGSVSAGIATFGLAAQLVPVIGNLFNQHWNNDQSEWNLYVEPFVNESFFLAEDGIRPKAQRYRVELLKLRGLRRAYDAALSCRRTEEAVERAEASLTSAETAGDAERLSRARNAMETARLAQEEATKRWEDLAHERRLPDVRTVNTTYPQKIEEQAAVVRERKGDLRALEEGAFEKVALFRRGLPDDLRAFPGFIPLPGENYGIFVNRIRRLRNGTRAYKSLQDVEEMLTGRDAAVSHQELTEAVAAVAAAIELLEPLATSDHLLAQKQEIDEHWEELNKELLAVREELGRSREQRRKAQASEFGAWDRAISQHSRQARSLQKQIEQLDLRNEQIQKQLHITTKVGEIIAELGTLKETLAGAGDHSHPSIVVGLRTCMAGFPEIDACWTRFMVGDVPWSHWLKPTLLWMIVVGFMYVIMMSFNVLIFRQWAYNERLIYPLAELPEVLAGNTAEDSPDSWIPALCRDPLFWVGFGIAFAVMGWNLACYTNLVPGLKALDLRNSWWEYIRNSPLQGLNRSGNSHVFFTLIGLTFMVPANISFSLWFFYVLYMLQLLVMVWAGYGVNESSFPTDWWTTLNFRSAEGSGALIVFAAVVLYKCRKYLFCFFVPSTVGNLDRSEQKELRISSFCFIFGSVGLVLSLWLGLGANLFWTLFVYLVMMVITIGLIRGVAEGGVLSLQANISPFHLIRSLFGMDKSWTNPSLFAPLMVFYSIFFLDLKTFIAPSMANSLKIRDDAKMTRGRFHLAIFLAIFVAVLASVLLHITMAYGQGADSMRRWFHTSFPQILFSQICTTAKTCPVDVAGGRYWLGVGAVLMAALLYFRRMVFWLPHPIGFIMLINPLMSRYWFSIFLAWLAKRLVTKYGNKDTYKRVRRLFVGLILGELAIVVLALVASHILDMEILLNLNR